MKNRDEIAGLLKSFGLTDNEAMAESRWITDYLGKNYAGVLEIAVEKENEILERRKKREPLQYILGEADFRYLTLEVNSNVLIPRPETEELCDLLLKHIPGQGRGIRLLDLGCGSGAVSLAMAYECPEIEVTAVDISPAALAVSRKNAVNYQLKNVCFLQSDLFSNLPADEKFDLIAANLPYVSYEEYAVLEPEVKNFEPELALTAADGGCELMKKAAADAVNYLKKGGRIFFELSPHQAEIIADYMKHLGYREVAVITDLTRRNRFVSGVPGE